MREGAVVREGIRAFSGATLHIAFLFELSSSPFSALAGVASIASSDLPLSKAIQFAYTCIFGWYANFLHLRTGNLLAPLTAHVFCNIMGLPNPAGASKRHMQRKGVIYAAHLVGIVGFAWGIAAL